MRNLSLLTLAAALALTGCTHPHTHDAAADEQALRDLDARWVTVAQAHDVDGWLAFYTPEAVLLPPNESTAAGATAIRKSVSDLLGLPNSKLTWRTTRSDVSGDLGYLVGHYELAFDGPGGKRVTDNGKTLEIWKRQPDGSWKCVVDTWSSDLPATAM